MGNGIGRHDLVNRLILGACHRADGSLYDSSSACWENRHTTYGICVLSSELSFGAAHGARDCLIPYASTQGAHFIKNRNISCTTCVTHTVGKAQTFSIACL